MHLCMYVCMHACMDGWMYVCTYVRMYVCMCNCISKCSYYEVLEAILNTGWIMVGWLSIVYSSGWSLTLSLYTVVVQWCEYTNDQESHHWMDDNTIIHHTMFRHMYHVSTHVPCFDTCLLAINVNPLWVSLKILHWRHWSQRSVLRGKCMRNQGI